MTAALVAFALGACGGGADEAFSEAERAVIREDLGTLPAAPGADPTNAFADDPLAAELGQDLFFETRYSANGEVSCATCHAPEDGFQDRRTNTSEGLAFTTRHAPTVINAAFGHADPSEAVWQFWDGRKDSEWSQALGPPENAMEMGSSRGRVALLVFDHYREQYEAVFGPMPELRDADGVARYPEDGKPGTPEWESLSGAEQDALTAVYVNFGKAIAAYERRIVSRNSRFDRFHEEIASGASDSDALSAAEKKGLRLFIGKGACIECHRGPNFTDWAFHNIGVAQDGPHLPAEDQGRAAAVDVLLTDEFNCASRWSDHPDKTSCTVHDVRIERTDHGAFKTPGLRDVTKTAPYMHTGMDETLEDVIEHYDRGGDESGFVGTVDEKIAKLGLSSDEKAALAVFLAALEGEPLDAALMQPRTRP